MTHEHTLARLASDALRHITPIKFISLYGTDVQCTWFGECLVATVLAQVSQYDRVTYPEATMIVYPALPECPDAATLSACVEHIVALSRTERVVCKTLSEPLIAALNKRVKMEEVRALSTFTLHDYAMKGQGAVESASALAGLVKSRVLEHGVYSENELDTFFESGEARCYWIAEGDEVNAIALTFPTTAEIHEIGNVYVVKRARRQGYAQALVCAAVHNLQGRNLTARYVVDTANTASIALATACGLREVFRLRHFTLNP